MPDYTEDIFGCTRRYIIVRMPSLSLGKGPHVVMSRSRQYHPTEKQMVMGPEFDRKVAEFNNLEDAIKFVRLEEGNNVRQEEQ